MKNDSLLSRLSVVLVSIYLFFVALWLLATKQIPNPDLGKLVRLYLRKPYAAKISAIHPEQGFCWVAEVPEYLISDDGGISQLAMFEDNQPLGPAHMAHEEIRTLGSGRYSHWRRNLYFSTSDNSNPTVNGRSYMVREIR